ncbi:MULTISPECIES: hypothetical protein [Streptomyces]|uniref:hypothetical protein n=1 Tax=Streptomyces TaxID=1883 RepID=UPI0036E2369C
MVATRMVLQFLFDGEEDEADLDEYALDCGHRSAGQPVWLPAGGEWSGAGSAVPAEPRYGAWELGAPYAR